MLGSSLAPLARVLIQEPDYVQDYGFFKLISLSRSGTLTDRNKLGADSPSQHDSQSPPTFLDLVGENQVGSPVPRVRLDSAPPSSITVGAAVTTRICGANVGGSAKEGDLQIAFPGLTDKNQVSASSDISILAKGRGESIFANYGQNQISVQYVLIDAAKGPWASGESHCLTVTLTPTTAGSFKFQYKFTMQDPSNNQWVSDPPKGTGVQDQQSEWAYERSITVQPTTTAPPSAKISIDPYPSAIALGSSVSIKICGVNQGGPATEGDLQLAFPGLTDANQVTATSDINVKKVSKGDTIFANYGQGTIQAQYVLIDAFKAPWGSGETHCLTITVTPSSAGTFRFEYKFNLQFGSNQWVHDPPTGIGSSDQQNEWVYTGSMTVSAQPSFQFTISTPSSQSVLQVGSATFSFVVTTNSGTPQQVTLDLLNQPLGTTISWSQTTVVPSTSGTNVQLTIQTSCGTVAQTYANLQITGSGGGNSASSSNFSLTVNTSSSCQPLSFDFSIVVSPSSGSVVAGSTLSPAGTVTLTLLGGPTQGVTLSISGLPTNVGVDDLTGKSCSPTCSIMFGISTLSGTSPGTYALTITGSGGGKSHTTTYSLTVTSQPSDSASLIEFNAPKGNFNSGDSLVASVIVRNTGTTTRAFWVGLSYHKPDGSFYDVPPQQTNTLSPQQDQLLRFIWNLPQDAPAGQYGAFAAVWNGYDQVHNQMIEPRFDAKNLANSFSVGVAPAAGLYATFIPDPSDPTTGTLQIKDVFGSILKTVQLKKVRILVTYPSPSIPDGSLHVYAYLPIPFAPCIAEVFNPIPLAFDDMVEKGEYFLTNLVIKALTKVTIVGVAIEAIETGIKIIDCINGIRRVEIGGKWKFGEAQEIYLAVDQNPDLQAEVRYVGCPPPPSITSCLLFVEDGTWKGTIARSTDQISIGIAPREFDVSGGSSIGLMVVDPSGARVGAFFEKGKWQVVNEISGAFYSGLGTHPQHVAVPNPRTGLYRVLVTGNQTGTFQLNTVVTSGGKVTSIETLNGNVVKEASQQHQVLLTQERA